MPEFLVIVACLYQRGCTEASSTYYDSRPELQAYVHRMETQIRTKAGPIYDYGAPLFVFGFGGAGIIKLTAQWSIKASRSEASLNFNYSL